MSGRRIVQKTVRKDEGLPSTQPQTDDLSAGMTLKPGLYLIRLTQNGRSVTSRVTVVR